MDLQALEPLYDALHRYAGWLDRERSSTMVRADVQAVGLAIHVGADLTAPLEALDGNLARLPGGDLKKMLRAASATLRRAFVAQCAETAEAPDPAG